MLRPPPANPYQSLTALARDIARTVPANAADTPAIPPIATDVRDHPAPTIRALLQVEVPALITPQGIAWARDRQFLDLDEPAHRNVALQNLIGDIRC